MTVAEFIEWDDGTSTRYELIDGRPVAMNPPAARHAEIIGNIGRALDRQLAPPCRAYWSTVGVALGDGGTDWREPDLVVTCRPPARRFILCPRLVTEVLSPSTEKDDRTTKLDFYESFPSPAAILLVWQDERRVRLRERGPDGWLDHDVIGWGAVRLRNLDVELDLDGIYADPWADEAS